VSDAVAIGVGITLGSNNNKNETTTTGSPTTVSEQTAGDFGISLGGEFKGLGPIALLEVGLQFDNVSAVLTENDGTDTNKNSIAGSDLDLRVGMDITGDKGAFQRIELGVNTESLNAKTEPSGGPAANSFVESKNTAMGWNLGWAKGKSNDKGMGLGGFMLSGVSNTEDEPYRFAEVSKFDASTMQLAFVCAGEGKIKDWLTARAGLSSNLWQNNTSSSEIGAAGATTKNVNTNSGSPNTTITTGLSFIFGDITIDGVLNQDVLYTGSYFVSGIPAALFSQVSATWGWGGSKE
jgi:hypothetical protein